MTVSQLIEKLKLKDPDAEVMLLDSHNGGGYPRALNLGPSYREVTSGDAEEAGDCEELVGATVVVLGFGCY